MFVKIKNRSNYLFYRARIDAELEKCYRTRLFNADLIKLEIPPEVLELIPVEAAVKFNMIPLSLNLNGDTLALVTDRTSTPMLEVGPTRRLSIADGGHRKLLSKSLGVNCYFYYTDPENLAAALNHYYTVTEKTFRDIEIKYYDFEGNHFEDVDEIRDMAESYATSAFEEDLVCRKIPPEILNIVPAEFAFRKNLIPVEFDKDGNLILVTASQGSFLFSNGISNKLGLPCKIFFATDENIRAALAKYYGFKGLMKMSPFEEKTDNLADGDFLDADLLSETVPDEILDIVPVKIALKFSIIPLVFNRDGTLTLVTSSNETLQQRNEISDILNVNCKILLADNEEISDALEVFYKLRSYFEKPEGTFSTIRWNFLLACRPYELLQLQQDGNYQKYFSDIEENFSAKYNKMVENQLELENIDKNDFGLVNNITFSCREELIRQLCQ